MFQQLNKREAHYIRLYAWGIISLSFKGHQMRGYFLLSAACFIKKGSTESQRLQRLLHHVKQLWTHSTSSYANPQSIKDLLHHLKACQTNKVRVVESETAKSVLLCIRNRPKETYRTIVTLESYKTPWRTRMIEPKPFGCMLVE